MSREIKFRAWLTLSDYDDDGNDKDYHGMATRISVHQNGDIGFSVDEGSHIFGSEVFERAIDNGTAYEYEEWCHWEGHFELMQYTGLKDKNGVEIYEGDILSYEGFAGVVEYDAPEFIINDMIWTMAACEVIGNIYEHGHLLENKSKEWSKF